MIYHLQELAVDFRKASIEVLCFNEVRNFLKEVQRVYSNLYIDEQLEAEELWLGYSDIYDCMVIDTYHVNEFTPLVNIKPYLKTSEDEIVSLYSDLGGECYSHKIFFNDLMDIEYEFDEEEFFKEQEELRKAKDKARYENSFSFEPQNLYDAVLDIELPF